MIAEKIQNSISAAEENMMKRIKKPVQQLIDHHFKNLLEEQGNPFKTFLEQLGLH